MFRVSIFDWSVEQSTRHNRHHLKKPEVHAMTNAPAIPSTERIFSAVRELRAAEQIATRETVAALTGLKLSIVDDRLRTLVDDGRLKRLIRGVYELVEAYPAPRAISKTVLPNGYVKYDIGDDVITLTPKENRILALLQRGTATEVVETAFETLITPLMQEIEAGLRAVRQAVPELQQAQTDT